MVVISPVLAMSPLSSMAAYAAWTRFSALTPFFMAPSPPWPPRGDVGQLLAALQQKTPVTDSDLQHT